MDLRTIVAAYVDKAIDGTINYSGKDPDTNRHIWVNLITDRIIGSFMGVLPEPVDLMSKYELDKVKGLSVTIDPEDEQFNDLQLERLAHYAADDGYNNYRYEVENIVMKPYNLQKQKQSATLTPGDI